MLGREEEEKVEEEVVFDVEEVVMVLEVEEEVVLDVEEGQMIVSVSG